MAPESGLPSDPEPPLERSCKLSPAGAEGEGRAEVPDRGELSTRVDLPYPGPDAREARGEETTVGAEGYARREVRSRPSNWWRRRPSEVPDLDQSAHFGDRQPRAVAVEGQAVGPAEPARRGAGVHLPHENARIRPPDLDASLQGQVEGEEMPRGAECRDLKVRELALQRQRARAHPSRTRDPSV